jgi:hypothetical protein
MHKTRYFLDLFACNAVQNMLSQIANYAHPWLLGPGDMRDIYECEGQSGTHCDMPYRRYVLTCSAIFTASVQYL